MLHNFKQTKLQIIMETSTNVIGVDLMSVCFFAMFDNNYVNLLTWVCFNKVTTQ